MFKLPESNTFTIALLKENYDKLNWNGDMIRAAKNHASQI